MSFFFNFSGFLFTTAKVTSLSAMIFIAFIFSFLSSSIYNNYSYIHHFNFNVCSQLTYFSQFSEGFTS